MAKGITKPMYRRMLGVSLVLLFVGFSLLVVKLFSIQVLDYKKYQQKAIEQQTRDVTIAPKRGTIYDRNGKELAVSATAYMVYINPQSIKDGETETREQKIEKISTKLAEILGTPKEDLLASCNKKTYYDVVARRIEQEKADAILAFAKENKYGSIISVAEDPKRYYPFNNFASNAIGFTGSDNQGLAGLEQYYDEYLRGTPGRIITATDAVGNVMPTDDQMYIAPQDGSSLHLTIDEVIQHYLEKALERAVVESNVQKGASGIIMDVTTGEILAMSTKPDFNLNEPRTITDPNVLKMLSTLKGEELKNGTSTALQEMWRNKIINDMYMPGSVYKILTAAYALEENVVKLNDQFNCSGSVMVDGWDRPIRCDKRAGHGPETFVKGFQNSCNPVFINVGLRVGVEKTWAYTKAFGLN
ncbi:MAG: penicillin-binding transpeptidase domain-containing protein, partial [Clostridia bacterium]